MRRALLPVLSMVTTFTRYCPETGEEVEIDGVTVRGTWYPGEPGNHIDPPVQPGIEDLVVVVNGRDAQFPIRWCPETGVRIETRGSFKEVFPLSLSERDWVAEQLGEDRG